MFELHMLKNLGDTNILHVLRSGLLLGQTGQDCKDILM
jgi:hypothetical protein